MMRGLTKIHLILQHETNPYFSQIVNDGINYVIYVCKIVAEQDRAYAT
jgi:hypothetical protein